jgi:hypothetical protein
MDGALPSVVGARRAPDAVPTSRVRRVVGGIARCDDAQQLAAA